MNKVDKTTEGKLMCGCTGQVTGQAIATDTIYSPMLGQYLVIAQVEYTCTTCTFKWIEFPMKWTTELDKPGEEIEKSLYPGGN